MEVTQKICIRGARVFDPAQQWQGELHDLYLADGLISDPFDDPDLVIEADGRPAMAGGIDPHCHLASPGQAYARLTHGLPSPGEIGEIYARMGYVHVHQPFATLLTAGAVQRSLHSIPYLDKSFWISIDLRDMGKYFKTGNQQAFSDEARALVHLTGALGLFLPFPHLRHKQRYYIQKNVSPKKTFEFISGIEDSELLPIVLWGRPGLIEAEIPEPGHFHIAGLNMALDSEVARENAAKFLDAGGKADLGLNHGESCLAVDSTEDFPPGSLSIDVGIHNSLPFRYQTEKTPMESDLSKAGWELLSVKKETWHLAFSSLCPPSRGTMLRIPATTAWLLTSGDRPTIVKEALNLRSFDLYEIARMTRYEPARCLRLEEDSGHLKIGARANVAIYDLDDGMSTRETIKALSDCWCLIKDGIPVRENGSFTGTNPPSSIRYRELEADIDALKDSDLLLNPTLKLENLKVERP